MVSLNRTLDQELLAISRGASMECLACGEFLMRDGPNVRCPECGATLAGPGEAAETPVQLGLQAG